MVATWFLNDSVPRTNPVRAGMVNDPGDFRWSSYRVHGFGLRSRMWTPHANYLTLGSHAKARQSAYRELMNEALEVDVIATINGVRVKCQSWLT